MDGDGGSFSSAFVDLLGAGGGGGPVLLAAPAGAAAGGGGGGGGAREPFVRGAGGGGGAAGDAVIVGSFIFSCSSRRNPTINSWFSLIKSSVRPLSLRSLPKCSRHSGSKASSSANSDGGRPKFPFI